MTDKIGFQVPKDADQLRLKLEFTEAEEEDGSWKLTAITTVSDREGPRSHISVYFYYRSERRGDPIETDAEGKALMEFPGLRAERHEFRVQIAGTTLEKKDKVDIKPEKLDIKLELTEPVKEDSEWSMTATATVTGKNNEPRQGKRVVFYRNGTETDIISTDSGGRARKEFADLKKGPHTIEARIHGTAKSDIQVRTIKEDKPKRVANLTYHSMIRGTACKVIFHASQEDGTPASGVSLQIVDQTLPRGARILEPTDKGGNVSYDITFKRGRYSCDFTVLSPGGTVSKFITVYR